MPDLCCVVGAYRYPEARENVVALNNMGVRVLHGIDATKLEDPRLGTQVADT